LRTQEKEPKQTFNGKEIKLIDWAQDGLTSTTPQIMDNSDESAPRLAKLICFDAHITGINTSIHD